MRPHRMRIVDFLSVVHCLRGSTLLGLDPRVFVRVSELALEAAGVDRVVHSRNVAPGKGFSQKRMSPCMNHL